MSSVPAFINLKQADQAAKFREISRTCDKHIESAYTRATRTEWAILEGISKENRSRNRYLNVHPWDKTRIKLPIFPGAKSDYINASDVRLDSSYSYIAAQGPLKNTIPHFWAMAFHQADLNSTDTIVIAMMTPLVEGGREKCAQYWPDLEGVTWDFTEDLRSEGISPGMLKLTTRCSKSILHGDLILTELSLDLPTTIKKVLHYQYLGWEDAKTPDSVEPIMELSSQIHNVRVKDPAVTPIVHCSAGVGRTGTFIAIDYMLHGKGALTSSEDPVFDIVTKLRNDRMMMVQTVYQYVFLYDVAKRLYEVSKKKNA